jgi:CHRD domain
MTLLLTTITIFGVSSQFSNVMAQRSQKFKATLNGDSEIPPVQTKASGDATFELKSDGKTMDYAVNVKSIDKVLYAHIHEGKIVLMDLLLLHCLIHQVLLAK